MSNFFTSSVGKKFTMALAGLFLVLFLVVHLGINILVILFDNTRPFNVAAHFMSTNLVIRTMEIVLFAGFLLHMIYGIIVSIQNLIARPRGYKIANYSQLSFFSKFMLHTAIIVGIFLVLHLIDFYVKSRFLTGSMKEVSYNNGQTYMHDMGQLIIDRFKIGWVVIVYVVALLGLGFHLHHGFQSAFQTIGFNHPVYTPVIKTLGVIYTLVITIGFISIPVVVYFFK
jgi:succinate dehydrogenase / fumarate reductase, cytochrome b subunit